MSTIFVMLAMITIIITTVRRTIIATVFDGIPKKVTEVIHRMKQVLLVLSAYPPTDENYRLTPTPQPKFPGADAGEMDAYKFSFNYITSDVKLKLTSTCFLCTKYLK